jgi:hypothetical protein
MILNSQLKGIQLLQDLGLDVTRSYETFNGEPINDLVVRLIEEINRADFPLRNKHQAITISLHQFEEVGNLVREIYKDEAKSLARSNRRKRRSAVTTNAIKPIPTTLQTPTNDPARNIVESKNDLANGSQIINDATDNTNTEPDTINSTADSPTTDSGTNNGTTAKILDEDKINRLLIKKYEEGIKSPPDNYEQFLIKISEGLKREGITLSPEAINNKLTEEFGLTHLDYFSRLINIPLPSTAASQEQNGVHIIKVSCPLLDKLGVKYDQGLPSYHQLAIKYTAIGDPKTATALHTSFHNFHMAKIIDVEITYSNGKRESLIIPTAECKRILEELKPAPSHLA